MFSGSLRELFDYYYSRIRKHALHNFWKDVTDSEEFQELANEANFIPKTDTKTAVSDSDSKDEVKDSVVPVELCSITAEDLLTSCVPQPAPVNSEIVTNIEVVSDSDSDSDCFISDDWASDAPSAVKLRPDPSDSELFCLGRTLGTQDYIGQRVLQVRVYL